VTELTLGRFEWPLPRLAIWDLECPCIQDGLRAERKHVRLEQTMDIDNGVQCVREPATRARAVGGAMLYAGIELNEREKLRLGRPLCD